MQALNHPKGNFLWEHLSRGKLSGVNYLRGKRPRANYPPGNNLGHLSRWQSSRGRFFSGAIVRRAGGGGGNFPRCNRPDTVDNTLSIHFGEVQLINKLSKLNITYDNYRVKQFHIVEQPGYWWIHGDEIS